MYPMSMILTACTYTGKVVSGKNNIDPLNSKRIRNQDNVNSINFNCCGFCLNTFNWSFPFVNKDVIAELMWTPDRLDDEEFDSKVKEALNKEFSLMITNIVEWKNMSLKQAEEQARSLFYKTIYNSSFAIEYATKCLLATNLDMRKIDNLNDIQDDEYGIIYAGSRNDFHFVKYDQLSNIYSHKMGNMPIKTVSNYDEAFGLNYNSERVFFAKKR